MDNVQFDNNAYTNKLPRFQKEDESFLTRMAMKLGAKNRRQAQIILLAIAIFAIVLMVFVIITQFTHITKTKVIFPPTNVGVMR